MIEGLIFDCQEKQLPHCAPIQTSRHFHRDSRGIGFEHQTRAAVCRLGKVKQNSQGCATSSRSGSASARLCSISRRASFVLLEGMLGKNPEFGKSYHKVERIMLDRDHELPTGSA